MLVESRVGPITQADGTPTQIRLTRDTAIVTDAVHGRYAEMVARGNVYQLSAGQAGVALAATTVSQTAATATPIVGFLNPFGSGVVCSVQWAAVGAIATGAATVNEGNYLYQVAGSGLVNASTTVAGTVPTNLKTNIATGSRVIGAGGTTLVAFTGNTATWVHYRAFGGSSALAVTRTASVSVNGMSFEEVSGLIQIQPGQAFGIFNETSTTTVTAGAYLVWEEVPLFLFT